MNSATKPLESMEARSASHIEQRLGYVPQVERHREIYHDFSGLSELVGEFWLVRPIYFSQSSQDSPSIPRRPWLVLPREGASADSGTCGSKERNGKRVPNCDEQSAVVSAGQCISSGTQ